MRMARVLGFGLLGVVVLGIVLVGVMLWRFNTPSASAQRLAQVFTDRQGAPDADNAYIYVWGFLAPAEQDPVQAGAKNIALLREKIRNADFEYQEVLGDGGNWSARRSPEMARMARACADGAATPCAQALEQWPRDTPFTGTEIFLAGRYDGLVNHRRWFETLPFHASAPLPPFAQIMDAQRLMLVQLRKAGAAGDAPRLREQLQRDLTFWREVMKSSDILISKMIACAAMRNHFFFGNLAMRALPAELRAAAIPDAWRVPVSADERSMLRVIAGEFEFARVMTSEAGAQEAMTFDDDLQEDDFSPFEQVMRGLTNHLRPWQRELNRMADVYLASAEAYTAPLDQYRRITSQLDQRFKKGGLAITLTDYVYRVGTVEGMRRAALLTAELRSRGVPAAEVPREVQRASLRNPFTQEPFEWDVEQRAVVYQGPENHRWRRHVYFY